VPFAEWSAFLVAMAFVLHPGKENDMKLLEKHRRTGGGRRPFVARPQVEQLEDRLALGETVLGSLFGMSMVAAAAGADDGGVALDFSDSSPAQTQTLASSTEMYLSWSDFASDADTSPADDPLSTNTLAIAGGSSALADDGLDSSFDAGPTTGDDLSAFLNAYASNGTASFSAVNQNVGGPATTNSTTTVVVADGASTSSSGSSTVQAVFSIAGVGGSADASGAGPVAAPSAAPGAAAPQVDTTALQQQMGNLPLQFEANVGQGSSSAAFLARGGGLNMGLNADGFQLTGRSSAGMTDVQVHFDGANPNAAFAPEAALPTKTDYFIGNDPSQWHTNVPTYDHVLFQNVYAGIDVNYHSAGGHLEYDFIVHPGADASAIKLDVSGAQSVGLDSAGNLVLHSAAGNVTEHAPQLYQDVNGVRQAVSGNFVLHNGVAQFQVGHYDSTQTLVIDPITFSTYDGSAGNDGINTVKTDAAGNIYVGGFTTQPSGFVYAFIQRINLTLPAGQQIAVNEIIGGAGTSVMRQLAVDPNPNNAGIIYVVGNTTAQDFPHSPGLPGCGTVQSGFMMQIDTGVQPGPQHQPHWIWSICTTGAGEDQGQAVTFDVATGNPFFTGEIDGRFVNGAQNLFITELSSANGVPVQTRVFDQYELGPFDVIGNGIVTDLTSHSYITGSLLDRTTNTLHPFVLKLRLGNPASPFRIDWYQPGSSVGVGAKIVLDNPVAPNFAFVAGALGNAIAGGSDLLLAKLNVANGGSGAADGGFDFRYVSPGGKMIGYDIVVSGAFEFVAGLDNRLDANGDVLVAKFDQNGISQAFQFFGGALTDVGYSLAIGQGPLGGTFIVAGATNSLNFPVTANAPQPLYGGGNGDGFVTQITQF
jgi:hypothetical protein